MCHQFRLTKSFLLKRVKSPFSVGIFCLKISKNSVGEPFCNSQNFRYRKFFLDIRGGGEGEVNNNFCKYFLSHSIEKFRSAIFLRFTIFQVSKVFMDKRGVGEGDVINNFCNKSFFSQCRKTL